MIALITWSVAAFAFSWALADSKISFPFREWLSRGPSLATWLLTLLECVACSGAHAGWIGQLAGVAPFSSWWIAALFTCGSNLLLAKFLGMIDRE